MTIRLGYSEKGSRYELNRAKLGTMLPDALDGMTERRRSFGSINALKDHYRAVQSIDEGLGRVLEYLDDEGLSDNTLVIYTTDNGFILANTAGMTSDSCTSLCVFLSCCAIRMKFQPAKWRSG